MSALHSQLFRALDLLAFSGTWVSLAAASLAVAASLAMGIAPDPRAAGVALLGTFAIYGLDRLRDLDRDRLTSPRRSQFVLRHENRLAASALLAATGAVALGLSLGARAVSLLALVLALGLFHRRLKHIRLAKPLYIALAWCAVVVQVPAAVDPRAEGVARVGLGVGLAILANAIASNVRDGESALARGDRALWLARLVAAASLLALLPAPTPIRPLAAVPAATLLSLLRRRMSERWGLVVVDGALLAGAALAVLLQPG